MLAAARIELAASLKELRDIARGLHPAVLSCGGSARRSRRSRPGPPSRCGSWARSRSGPRRRSRRPPTTSSRVAGERGQVRARGAGDGPVARDDG